MIRQTISYQKKITKKKLINDRLIRDIMKELALLSAKTCNYLTDDNAEDKKR